MVDLPDWRPMQMMVAGAVQRRISACFKSGWKLRQGWANRTGSVGVVGTSNILGAVKLGQRAQFSLAYCQNNLICREIRLDFSGMSGTHGLQMGWFGLCFRS